MLIYAKINNSNMINRQLCVLSAIFVITLSLISFAYAADKTVFLVAGKVYSDPQYKNPFSGATLSIKCGDYFPNTWENIKSLSDGTFAVASYLDVCNSSSNIEIINKTDQAIYYIHITTDVNIEDIPADTPIATGGRGRRVIIDEPIVIQETTPIANGNSGNEEPITLQTTDITAEQTPGFFSAITGAVTGTLGIAGSIIVLAIIVILLIALGIVIYKRKTRK